MKDKKLFIVEFGAPDVIHSWSVCKQDPVFVVAKDYNEAANKAMMYIEYKEKNKPEKSIISYDGSLDLSKDDNNDMIKIKAIKLATEEVIW